MAGLKSDELLQWQSMDLSLASPPPCRYVFVLSTSETIVMMTTPLFGVGVAHEDDHIHLIDDAAQTNQSEYDGDTHVPTPACWKNSFLTFEFQPLIQSIFPCNVQLNTYGSMFAHSEIRTMLNH